MATNVTFPNIPLKRNLINGSYRILDDVVTSEYFNIKGLIDNYGKGIHTFAIEGSNLLIPGSQILYELIDANGYIIPLNAIVNIEQYPSYIFNFQILDSTTNGMATLAFVGCSIENNQGKLPENYEYDIIWAKKIRVNIKANLDFHEIIAVDNLFFLSGSAVRTVQSGSASNNNIILTWESMYGKNGQSASQANGIISYISEYQWKQVEKYYIYMFSPTGSENVTASALYPSFSSSFGIWVLIDTIEAPKLSSSQYFSPSASVYYIANNLPNNKFLSFWVGCGKDTTFKNESSTAIRQLPYGTPTPAIIIGLQQSNAYNPLD